MDTAALRRHGLAIAVAIASVEGIIGFALTESPILFAGLPAVALLGYRLAPVARTDRAAAILAMATGAIPLAAMVTVAAILIADGAVPSLEVVFGSLYLTAVGIVIFGLPALVVTLPSAVLWAWLVRRAEPTG